VNAASRRFLEAQLAGDRHGALRVVVDEGVNAGMPIAKIHLEIIRPAQLEIGRLWQENEVTIAQEHLATGIAQLAMARLYAFLPRERPLGKRALLACVEGELHDMGPRMSSDFLEMAGFDVRFLGANVPVSSLVRMVETNTPDVLILSVTLPIHLDALRRSVEGVSAVRPELPILAGGYAFRWDEQLAKGLPVKFVGTDAEALVSAAKSAVGAP
jgi:methanogenic corrinoid protein MtbC1